MGEILVVKKKHNYSDKLTFRVTDKKTNQWAPNKYEFILSNKDANMMANLLYDLYRMGYPIDKAVEKFRRMLNEPELFFLR